MKKLKLSELRAQLGELVITSGSISTLISVIKNAESKYEEFLPYKNAGIDRFKLPYSNSDIKHLKHILTILEKPSEFRPDEDYLISMLENPNRLSQFLEKFSNEKSSIKCIIDDMSALIKEHRHGM